ncbi:phosphotransferase enzyme family protein [Streptomyces sp. NPDC088182]|uniref:phosphotransferase enzyme family protein n=1 Tax=Streptomyces sp. NPDC088182 TaxID=3365838 RepID=UPI003807E7EA
MSLDRLVRNLGVLEALAGEGIPVSAPVPTVSGALVAEVDGGVWCLFPWAAGSHLRGVDLSLSQAASLGTHLGRLHEGLGRACGSGLLPVVAETVASVVAAPERAVEKSERLSGLLEDKGAGAAFDTAAAAAQESCLRGSRESFPVWHRCKCFPGWGVAIRGDRGS